MSTVQIDPGVREEVKTVIETAHRFAEEVLRPVGAELDKLTDPADVIAPGSPLWPVFDRYRELGLTDMASPELGLSPAEQAYLQSAVG